MVPKRAQHIYNETVTLPGKVFRWKCAHFPYENARIFSENTLIRKTNDRKKKHIGLEFLR